MRRPRFAPRRSALLAMRLATSGATIEQRQAQQRHSPIYLLSGEWLLCKGQSLPARQHLSSRCGLVRVAQTPRRQLCMPMGLSSPGTAVGLRRFVRMRRCQSSSRRWARFWGRFAIGLRKFRMRRCQWPCACRIPCCDGPRVLRRFAHDERANLPKSNDLLRRPFRIDALRLGLCLPSSKDDMRHTAVFVRRKCHFVSRRMQKSTSLLQRCPLSIAPQRWRLYMYKTRLDVHESNRLQKPNDARFDLCHI